MKRLLSIIIILIILVACNKEELREVNVLHDNDAIPNDIPTPLPSYSWRQVSTGFLNQYPYTAFNAPTLTMKANEDVYLLAGSLLEFMFRFNPTLKKFEPYTPSPTNSVGFTLFSVGHQYLFSYGSKIYGGMADNGPDKTFFFSIDPQTAIIQELARFPGIFSNDAISFVLGNKGYVVSGYTTSETCKVWAYDFAGNTWTNIGNSPLGKRSGAVGVVVNNKVYMGLGYETTNFNGQTIRVYKYDWIEYTPGSSYNAVKANFPGAGRIDAKGFVINNSLYLGFGQNPNTQTRFKDLWRYNSSSNTWTKQADWPGIYGNDDAWFGGNVDNVGIFSVGSTGYLVKGGLNQFWHFTNSPFIIQ